MNDRIGDEIMSLEKVLTVERAKNGNMSIDEMCDKLGVSRSTYYGWIRSNGASLKASTVKQIAELFNVSHDYILQSL